MKKFLAALGLWAAFALPTLAQTVTTPPPPNLGKVINIFSYLTATQIADVQARTRSLDLTTPITAAVAAVNATNGAQFVWPAGDYYTATCNFTLTAPFALQGVVGTRVDSAVAGGTAITCGSNTAVLFTVNSLVGKFENVALVDAAASRSAGSAIYVTSANAHQKVDYEGLTVDGFYDGVDVAVGSSWMMHASLIQNAKHWGVRVRNTVNADAGDWRISDSWIYPASGGLAGVRYESSGGGMIVNTAILPNSGTIVNCLSMDTTGIVTVEFTFAHSKCDGATGIGLNILRGLSRTVIVDSTIKTSSLTDPAISLSYTAYGYIGGNSLWGNGGTYAIDPVTSDSYMLYGPNINNGFTNILPTSLATGALNMMAGVTLGVTQIPLGSTATTITGMVKTSGGYFTSTLTAKPTYNLNSTGSFYGQINNVSADLWALGYGANETNLGTSALTWNGAGLITIPSIATDATHTDSSVCQDTSTHALYSGSGTLGICLGTSSARYKTDIAPLGEGLLAIMALRPVSYHLDAAHGDPAKLLYGFTAEDMVGPLPALVDLDTTGHPNTADYLGVVPVLVNAVQELSAANSDLSRRLESIERAMPLQSAAAQ